MNLTIKQTIHNPLNEGIFHEMKALGVEWLNDDNAKLLDLEYYFNHSGDKLVSPLYLRTMAIDSIYGLKTLASLILLKYGENWDRLFAAFYAEYNPIENYNMVQTETPDITKTRLNKVKTDNETEVNNYESTHGFNSSDAVPTQNAKQVQTVKSDPEKNYTDETETETGTRGLTRSGNIGVTTSQQMVESELKLREYNVYEKIMSDIDKELALAIY